MVVLRHVMVVGGIGVGGGSLVYAAVLAAQRVPGMGRSRCRLGERTGTALRDLGPEFGREPNPQWGVQDDWPQGAARELGVAETFGKTMQGIRFSDCVACGQCITGCPHGAKRFDYLPAAEALGVEIRPLTKAEILMPLRNGWRVVSRERARCAASRRARWCWRAVCWEPSNCCSLRVIAGGPCSICRRCWAARFGRTRRRSPRSCTHPART